MIGMEILKILAFITIWFIGFGVFEIYGRRRKPVWWSSLRGHPIYFDGVRCYYSDTGEPTEGNWLTRPCGHCGEHFTTEGHDPCIGTLPGVMNACCGHGEVAGAYVQLNVLSGEAAIAFIKEHGR